MRFYARNAQAEIDEEITDHLAREAERLASEDGCGAENAQESASRRFGDVDTIRQECTALFRSRRRRRLQNVAACAVLLVAGAAFTWTVVRRPVYRSPGQVQILTSSTRDLNLENRLYGMRRRGDWHGLLIEGEQAIGNRSIVPQSRAYAALCRIEACRALSSPDQEAWIAFTSIEADLSERPDIEWLVRRMRKDGHSVRN